MKNSDIGNADLHTGLALRGGALCDDDFTEEAIARWFEDERQGYFDRHGNSEQVEDYQRAYTYAALAAERGLICRLQVCCRTAVTRRGPGTKSDQSQSRMSC